jgi:glycerol-3-phosphate acyltransferase PlsY
MVRSALVVITGYLFGAVPVAYLTGRALRGIDIRQHGSGNVGASNVWQTVSKAAVIPVGLAEIAQGAAPIFVARSLGEPRGVQVLAGVASLAGHNWSPFLRFTGGRGVGPAIGIMSALSRPALIAFTMISLAGVALRAIPQAVGLGIIAAPAVALLRREPPESIAGLSAVATLIFAKRAFANDASPPRDASVLTNRLLYDRDTKEREAWVRGVRPRITVGR